MSIPSKKKVDKDVRDPPHPTAKPHVCPDCGFRTTNRGNLTRHVGSDKCKGMAARRAPAQPTPPFPSSNSDDAEAASREGRDSNEGSSEESDNAHGAGNDIIDLEDDQPLAPHHLTLDRLWNDMNAFGDAAAYLQTHNTLKRHIVATEEAIAHAKTRLELATAERNAAQVRVDEATLTHTNANRIAASTEEALAAKRAHLEEVTREHDDLTRKHTALANINATVARRLDECIAELSAPLPAGVFIHRVVAAHYTDEQGLVDEARIGAFIDRVSPGLRERLALSQTAVKKAQDDVNELIVIQTETKNATAEATRRLDAVRQDLVAKSAAAEALVALVAEYTKEMAALNAREENDFFRHEHASTGPFGALSLPVQRLVLEMRDDPELVKDIGDLAYATDRVIPRAMVNRFPFVLNDTVLGRHRTAHGLIPANATCAICSALLNNAEVTRTNPLVITPCDHYFHAACFDKVYAKERAHHDEFFHKTDSSVVAPCPQCNKPVTNTAFSLVNDDRYYF